MRLISKLLVFSVLLVVSACGGGTNPPQGNKVPAGKYIGTFTIEGSSPFARGTTVITVDGAGNFTGTATADSMSGSPNDVATLTGSFKPNPNGVLVDVDWTYTSSKLGTYTAKGSEPFSAALKQFAFSPSARNTSNVIVGRFFLIGEPQ